MMPKTYLYIGVALLSGLVATGGVFAYTFFKPAEKAKKLETFVQEVATLTGSITVCKVLLDDNDQPLDGKQTALATFSLAGIAAPPIYQDKQTNKLPTSLFILPLTLNTAIIGIQKDAQCITYDNLALGIYLYGPENSLSADWKPSLYYDDFTSSTRLNSFVPYDIALWDDNPENDSKRNLMADGEIILTDEKLHQTIVVISYLKAGVEPVVQKPRNLKNLSCYFACEEDSQCKEGSLCLTVGRIKRCINLECPLDDTCTCKASSTSTTTAEMQKIIDDTKKEYESRQSAP